MLYFIDTPRSTNWMVLLQAAVVEVVSAVVVTKVETTSWPNTPNTQRVFSEGLARTVHEGGRGCRRRTWAPRVPPTRARATRQSSLESLSEIHSTGNHRFFFCCVLHSSPLWVLVR